MESYDSNDSNVRAPALENHANWSLPAWPVWLSQSLNGLWKHNMKQILANLSARVLSILSNILNVDIISTRLLSIFISLEFPVCVRVSQWKIRFDLNRKWFCDTRWLCYLCFSISNCLTLLSLVDGQVSKSQPIAAQNSVRETFGPPPTAPGPVARWAVPGVIVIITDILVPMLMWLQL